MASRKASLQKAKAAYNVKRKALRKLAAQAGIRAPTSLSEAVPLRFASASDFLFQRRHTRDQTGTATHRGSMSLQPVFAASAEESVEACRGARMMQEDSA